MLTSSLNKPRVIEEATLQVPVNSIQMNLEMERVAVDDVEEYEDEDWEYLDETQMDLRSKFYESWLWREVDLPSKPDRDG